MELNDTSYVFVDKKTLQVRGVSPVNDGLDDTVHAITVSRNLAISLINEPHLCNNYIAYHDGTSAFLIKRENVGDLALLFSPILIQISDGHENLQIDVYKDRLEFVLSKQVRGFAANAYGAMGTESQTAKFYVCAKNDPNKLIEIINIDMMQLIAGKNEVVNGEYDFEKISIFTRKVFDSYGINIKSK